MRTSDKHDFLWLNNTCFWALKCWHYKLNKVNFPCWSIAVWVIWLHSVQQFLTCAAYQSWWTSVQISKKNLKFHFWKYVYNPWNEKYVLCCNRSGNSLLFSSLKCLCRAILKNLLNLLQFCLTTYFHLWQFRILYKVVLLNLCGNFASDTQISLSEFNIIYIY